MTPSPSKVALVTGAARGIGLAVAKRFLAEGWHVALLDIEDALLRDAVAGLENPDRTLALHCDVSDAEAVHKAMQALSARFGRLDALVNNAGVAVFAPLLETSDADWERVLAVNLTGPFLCTKAAAPLMREHGGGAIVNITSISAVRASTLRSAYGTSKAGLAHLTKQLAVELASLGIRVNGVAPGPVDTAMAKAVHTRKSAPTITTPSRSTATASRRNWRRRCSFCAATARATSPGRSWPSMAVLTPPASACRRCAANEGTGSGLSYSPRAEREEIKEPCLTLHTY
jgi:NAD(P)-dependent dehydrogenase (short-subunit alcohol dehydrogenase family)